MSDGERKVSASKTIDKKCVALDRYIKRLLRHPVLSKDVILDEFIRDDNVKEELSKTQPKYKGSNNIIAWRIKMLGSKNENDDWFMIQHGELKALHEEMFHTLESFKAVTKSKDKLRGKSADVKEILSTILAGRSNVKGNDLVSKMDMVADSQTAMSNMFAEELLSYDHISQLVTEYLLTIKEAHRVLEYGQEFQMDLKKFTHRVEETREKCKTLEAMELKFNAFKQLLNLELIELQNSTRAGTAKAFAECSAKSLSLAEFSCDQENCENSAETPTDNSEISEGESELTGTIGTGKSFFQRQVELIVNLNPKNVMENDDSLTEID